MSNTIARSLRGARDAFKKNDVEQSRRAHSQQLNAEEDHSGDGKHLKAMIYGGLDGIITTFAVVAGVAGADLGAGIVLVMGFANLFADGISMGVGDYLSSIAEAEYTLAERQRETWECDNFIEGEKKEMVDLYKGKGMSEADATSVVNIISKDKNVFVDIMMVEELGLMPEPESQREAAISGLVTFASFLVFGTVPLISYLVTFPLPTDDHSWLPFVLAIVLTIITLFGLGAFKSRFTGSNPIRSGFQILVNGGLAAAVSYLIAWGIAKAVGVEGGA